jgi:DNA invertase Pin-like site-specific DNA recombinase
MTYGYARCSTNDQKQDIRRQVEELGRLGAGEVFQEYAKGTDPSRTQLEALKKRVKAGDTIIVTELSRLTRSVHQLCHFLEWAADTRCRIIVGGFTLEPQEHPDPMIEGMVLMMGVFAQMERKTIVQRVRSGVAHARNNGKKLGRPSMSKANLPELFLRYYPDYLAGGITKSQLAQLCGRSRPTINRYLLIIAER